MSTIEKALDSMGGSRTPKVPAAVPPNSIERTGANKAPSDDPPRSTGPFTLMEHSASSHDRTAVVIPFDELQAKGFLTPAIPRGTTAEEFRTIKRPLLKNIAGQAATQIGNANLIMVTSALEGDGKTYCSLNLAMSIAMEQDKTVLYVDADVLKASAGKLLGIPPNTPGLIDILMDDTTEPEDVILSTNMDKLNILPAGTSHERATELLAGNGMQRLMMELSDRYADRVIVFDSSPLLLTTESAVLASFMGQIVFVAAANITPRHAVQEALEQIGPEKMVTVMLNKAPRRHFNLFGIGHSYGYGYGYGYGHRESAPDPRLTGAGNGG